MKSSQTPEQSEALLQRMRKEIEIRKEKLETGAANFAFPVGEKKKDPFLKKATAALERSKKKHGAVKKWPKFLRLLRRNQEMIDQGLIDSLQDVVYEAERMQKMLLSLASKAAESLELERQARSLTARVAFLENALHLFEQRLSSSAGTVPAAESKAENTLHNDLEDQRIDAFYLAFENQFRGSRELISQRLLHYLPWIEAVKKNLPDATGVDIGCGRGEWLELLKENGIAASGVDMNARMAAQCQSFGLDVECGDGIAYLRNLPANSQGILSGFHIVEHLPLGLFLELIQQAFRVLRPGGVAIFETPNPAVKQVSTYSFFFDPTHRNPVPSELLCFTATHAGFSKTHVEQVQPLAGQDGKIEYFDYAGIFMK